MDSVKISGAGPAGLSAAIILAREGYTVEIFEKNSDIGGRFHGEYQGMENWSDNINPLDQFKQMDLIVNFSNYPFYNLKITNEEHEWEFKCKKPAFYLVKRGPVPGSLDKGLENQALDNGVQINFNQKITDEEADIIATGPRSREKFAVAQGIVFKTDMDDQVLCILNDKAAFKGYSYLLVADGNATMATVLFDDFKNLRKCFEKTYQSYKHLLELDIKNPQKIGGVGSFSTQNRFTENDKLYAGEAAGLQDLLWGFGIKNAVKSGYLAAKSIIYEEDYQNKAHKYFNNRLKASLVNRFIWERFAINNYTLILNHIHKSQDHLKYLNSIHKFNFLQKIIYPLALMYMRNRYQNMNL